MGLAGSSPAKAKVRMIAAEASCSRQPTTKSIPKFLLRIKAPAKLMGRYGKFGSNPDTHLTIMSVCHSLTRPNKWNVTIWERPRISMKPKGIAIIIRYEAMLILGNSVS